MFKDIVTDTKNIISDLTSAYVGKVNNKLIINYSYCLEIFNTYI